MNPLQLLTQLQTQLLAANQRITEHKNTSKDNVSVFFCGVTLQNKEIQRRPTGTVFDTLVYVSQSEVHSLLGCLDV